MRNQKLLKNFHETELCQNSCFQRKVKLWVQSSQNPPHHHRNGTNIKKSTKCFHFSTITFLRNVFLPAPLYIFNYFALSLWPLLHVCCPLLAVLVWEVLMTFRKITSPCFFTCVGAWECQFWKYAALVTDCSGAGTSPLDLVLTLYVNLAFLRIPNLWIYCPQCMHNLAHISVSGDVPGSLFPHLLPQISLWVSPCCKCKTEVLREWQKL